MINKIILWVVSFLATILIGLYIYYFKFEVGLELSKSPEHWVWAADFFSGMLGTLQTFISVIFLVHTIGLQNKANTILETDAKNADLKRKMEVFETQFFNLIEAQRNLFDAMHLPLPTVEGDEKVFQGAKAVCLLEDILEDKTHQYKLEIVENADVEDGIFSIVRSFFVIQKTIDKHLSDKNGFSRDDRKDLYETQVHFTSYAQLRLILVAMKYTDTYAAQHLVKNMLFLEVLAELGYNDYLNDI